MRGKKVRVEKRKIFPPSNTRDKGQKKRRKKSTLSSINSSTGNFFQEILNKLDEKLLKKESCKNN